MIGQNNFGNKIQELTPSKIAFIIITGLVKGQTISKANFGVRKRNKITILRTREDAQNSEFHSIVEELRTP